MQFTKRPKQKSSHVIRFFTYLIVFIIGLGGRYVIQTKILGKTAKKPISSTSITSPITGNTITTGNGVDLPTQSPSSILTAQGVIRLQANNVLLETPSGTTFEVISTQQALAQYNGDIVKVRGEDAGFPGLYQRINVTDIWATSATSVDDTTVRYERPPNTTVLSNVGLIITHHEKQEVSVTGDIVTIQQRDIGITGNNITFPTTTITVSKCDRTTTLCRTRDIKRNAQSRSIYNGLEVWQLSQNMWQFLIEDTFVYTVNASKQEIDRIMPMINILDTNFIREYAQPIGPMLCDDSYTIVTDVLPNSVIIKQSKRGGPECVILYELNDDTLEFYTSDTSQTTDDSESGESLTGSITVGTGDTQPLGSDSTLSTTGTNTIEENMGITSGAISEDAYQIFDGMQGAYRIGLPKEVYYAGYESDATYESVSCPYKVHMIKYDRKSELTTKPDGIIDVCPLGTRGTGYIGDSGEYSLLYRSQTDQGSSYRHSNNVVALSTS